MTLETLLQENIAALKALTGLLSRGEALPVPPAAGAPPPLPPALQSAPPSTKSPEGGVTREQVQDLIVQVGQKNGEGRDLALALLARFGVQYLRDTREAQWPALAQMAKRVLEEDYDPCVSEEAATAATA